MYPTMEVRWFYPGAPPQDARLWFAGLDGPVDDQPARQDLYLLVTGGEGLGIKLRQGRIEFKQRRDELGQIRLHERVRGRLEHWRKWSFALASVAESLATVAAPAGAWTAVRKARLLRRYRLEGQTLRPLAPLAYAEAGCELELAEIWLGERAWWSLAFEAFGPEEGLRRQLDNAARLILDASVPVDLDGDHSYGYPRWLQIQVPG